MKKTIRLLAFCSVILLFSKCKTHCPSFTEEDWFPYSLNQELYFIGDTTFCMYVDTYDATKEYSQDNSCNTSCDNSLYLIIYSTDTSSCSAIWGDVFGNYHDISNIPDIRISLELRGGYDSFYAGADYDNYTFYDSLKVNGTWFSDVILINRDNSDDTEKDFIQIIIAKDYGIISMMDSDSNSYFLQDFE